jgi:hypothetical protein
VLEVNVSFVEDGHLAMDSIIIEVLVLISLKHDLNQTFL